MVTIRTTDSNPSEYCPCCWHYKNWNHPHLKDDIYRVKSYKHTCVGRIRTRQRYTKVSKEIPFVYANKQTTIEFWHGVDKDTPEPTQWNLDLLIGETVVEND